MSTLPDPRIPPLIEGATASEAELRGWVREAQEVVEKLRDALTVAAATATDVERGLLSSAMTKPDLAHTETAGEADLAAGRLPTGSAGVRFRAMTGVALTGLAQARMVLHRMPAALTCTPSEAANDPTPEGPHAREERPDRHRA